MHKVQYKMIGLTCNGCTCGTCGQPILIYLKCLDGILEVTPKFEENRVLITYDQQATSPKIIMESVQKRGFSIEEI